jgi:hypothetical protein
LLSAVAAKDRFTMENLIDILTQSPEQLLPMLMPVAAGCAVLLLAGVLITFWAGHRQKLAYQAPEKQDPARTAELAECLRLWECQRPLLSTPLGPWDAIGPLSEQQSSDARKEWQMKAELFCVQSKVGALGSSAMNH